MNQMKHLKTVEMQTSLVRSLHWQNCPALDNASLQIERLVSLYSDHLLLSKMIQTKHGHLLVSLKSIGYNVKNSAEGISLNEVIQSIPIQQMWKLAIHFEESFLKRTHYISEEVLSKLILLLKRVEYLNLEHMVELQNGHLELLSKTASCLKHLNIVGCKNVDAKTLIPTIKHCSKLRKITLGNTKQDLEELHACCRQRGIKLKFL